MLQMNAFYHLFRVNQGYSFNKLGGYNILEKMTVDHTDREILRGRRKVALCPRNPKGSPRRTRLGRSSRGSYGDDASCSTG